ncbi:hypothetical protein DF268_08635 [Streptomyces sp. V2]|uniref:hypothetical protein n=1 Tax=Streptomyces sp. V2 TaxID=1424099 RepID=UPI000D66E9D0|nr:hypothetical protein [Streptomyces sp. V2]PWG13922.1 hypothetical protein DF268_08635 [Streptomyces sp. V2]
MTNLAANDPTATLGELGGDCLCGRGSVIGTCVITDTRMWFRAFHDGLTAYHLQRSTDWACVDCVADNALAVANGEIRERMRQLAERRAAP